MKKEEFNSLVFANPADLAALKTRAVSGDIPPSSKQAIHKTGTAASPFKSRGMDFSEVRAYQAGDDIRQIDWRVTAKYGKPFTKLYIDEKDRQIYIVVDERSAMKFASRGVFKSVAAAQIAAMLLWIGSIKHHTLQTLILTPDTLKQTVTGTGDDVVLAILKDLSAATNPTVLGEDVPTLERAALTAAAGANKGALVFFISDFRDLNTAAISHLRALSSKAQVFLIHVYDEMERILPQAVLPLTNGKELTWADMKKESARQSYQRAFDDKTALIEKTAATYQMGYISIRTDADYLTQIISFTKGNGAQ